MEERLEESKVSEQWVIPEAFDVDCQWPLPSHPGVGVPGPDCGRGSVNGVQKSTSAWKGIRPETIDDILGWRSYFDERFQWMERLDVSSDEVKQALLLFVEAEPVFRSRALSLRSAAVAMNERRKARSPDNFERIKEHTLRRACETLQEFFRIELLESSEVGYRGLVPSEVGLILAGAVRAKWGKFADWPLGRDSQENC
jgi:hypothetical protein